MIQEKYGREQLLSDISIVINDISSGIADLKEVILLVKGEKEIVPYEQTCCKQCKEPCGRSNAEILKCITDKKQLKERKIKTGNQQYTKEYLEQDLKEIIMDLQKKEKHLKKIMENIQKGISHS